MMGNARLSPTARAIPDLQDRIVRLEAFEKWRNPTIFDFEAAAGPELWKRHWQNWERLFALMHECEVTAKEIRNRFSSLNGA
jgi:hypothetical protein